MQLLLLTALTFAKDHNDEALYEMHPDYSGKEKHYLVTDVSKIDHPRDIAEYQPLYQTQPIRQNTTNTCRCFCTTSLFCSFRSTTFTTVSKARLKNGYSIVIAGDVSEPGRYGRHDLGFVPSFDIPAEYINQDSREFRFYLNI